MAFVGRVSKPLPRAWVTSLKADRLKPVSVSVEAPRSRDGILNDPRTSPATRAWIIRMDQLQAKKREARGRRI